jgi:hypothetical protein
VLATALTLAVSAAWLLPRTCSGAPLREQGQSLDDRSHTEQVASPPDAPTLALSDASRAEAERPPGATARVTEPAMARIGGRLLDASRAPMAGVPYRWTTVGGGHVLATGSTSNEGKWSVPAGLAGSPSERVLRFAPPGPFGIECRGADLAPGIDTDVVLPPLARVEVAVVDAVGLADLGPFVLTIDVPSDASPTSWADGSPPVRLLFSNSVRVDSEDVLELPASMDLIAHCWCNDAVLTPDELRFLAPGTLRFTIVEEKRTDTILVVEGGADRRLAGRAYLRTFDSERNVGYSQTLQVEDGRASIPPGLDVLERPAAFDLMVLLADGRFVELGADQAAIDRGGRTLTIDVADASRPLAWENTLGDDIDVQVTTADGATRFASHGGPGDPDELFWTSADAEIRLYRVPSDWIRVAVIAKDGRVGFLTPSSPHALELAEVTGEAVLDFTRDVAPLVRDHGRVVVQFSVEVLADNAPLPRRVDTKVVITQAECEGLVWRKRIVRGVRPQFSARYREGGEGPSTSVPIGSR